MMKISLIFKNQHFANNSDHHCSLIIPNTSSNDTIPWKTNSSLRKCNHQQVIIKLNDKIYANANFSTKQPAAILIMFYVQTQIINTGNLQTFHTFSTLNKSMSIKHQVQPNILNSKNT